ncbi:competence protein ComEA [Deinococcus metalli]|uniref:Competence protein ComEA n=1 Tax=Deinococcus metalli TaxID=1141878 RepID=A0A7W8KG41_9DEIO|nr:helix-hairpin-helix domain-containing protein [Deinococcus metalli]MBB5377546.1 competence protein ComEA [Deinococcus metalli]GHF51267.1 hypothetical protein GCM10017781_29750 [Deinococcus metalli]
MKHHLIALTAAALLLAPATAFAKTTHTAMPKAAHTMQRVHINRATARQLETLPGVGKKIAAEIVKDRPFKNMASLTTKIKGISAMNIKKLEGLVSFN